MLDTLDELVFDTAVGIVRATSAVTVIVRLEIMVGVGRTVDVAVSGTGSSSASPKHLSVSLITVRDISVPGEEGIVVLGDNGQCSSSVWRAAVGIIGVDRSAVVIGVDRSAVVIIGVDR